MKNTFKFIVALATVCLCVACNKESEEPTDFSGGCKVVDLGLSVKWASYNVGALDEESFGSYFAYGETTMKTNYDWSVEDDYKWGIHDTNAKPLYGMTKYTGNSVEGGDGLKILQAIDDPATVNWGTKWRTPTLEEAEELFDSTKCQWSWDEARKGYTVKGLKTGNSIFLPAAGFRRGLDFFDVESDCYFWTSSVYEPDPSAAYYFFPGFRDVFAGYRSDGLSVRAVTDY